MYTGDGGLFLNKSKESDGKLYFHCAKEGHKLDAISKCDKAVDSDVYRLEKETCRIPCTRLFFVSGSLIIGKM